jgi:tRNA(His) 5'-end guanylyltransferase
MRAVSYPYSEKFLKSIADTTGDLHIDHWKLSETNILFFSDEGGKVFEMAEELFQERRSRVLARTNDFFWFLIVKNSMDAEKFFYQKSNLGFWDVFCLDISKDKFDCRSFQEITQSVKKLNTLCKATKL